MRLIQGLQNSCYFLRNSLTFLKKNPDLIILPALSIIALVFVLFSLIKILLFFQVSKRIFILGLVIIYFILAFISILFNAAFIAGVIPRLQGNKISILQAMVVSIKKMGLLLQWTMISSTIYVFFTILERISDAIAKLIATLFGFSWTMTTYFVLPIMVNENVGPITTFKQSSELVGKGWRNIVSLNFVVFLALVFLGGLGYLFASLFLHSQYTVNLTINVPLMLCLLICWFVMIKTANAIYNSALFLFIKGEKQEYFDKSFLVKVIIKPEK